MYQKVVKNKRQKNPTFSKHLEQNNIHVITDNSLFFLLLLFNKVLFIIYSLFSSNKIQGQEYYF